jgi:uncharacterized membrane protein
MITYSALYILAGLLFCVFAILSLRDTSNPKRVTTALFWGLFAASFLAGDYLGDLGNGVLVLAMALVAGFGGLGTGRVETTSAEQRQQLALGFGHKLLIPALMIPIITLIGTFALKSIFIGDVPLADPKQSTLISLAIASVLAGLTALWLFRQPVMAPFQEGRRLVDTIGWAALLPQMLASLGAVFALAGVGNVVGELATQFVPREQPAYRRHCLLHGHGAVHDGDGKCVRRVSGAHRRCRHSFPDPEIRWRPGCRCSHRHACRILRDADDATGCELQHRARRTA